MADYTLKSRSRPALGRAAAKKLRRDGYLPVNIYGHKEENRHVVVEYKEFEKFIGAGHRILTVEVDGGDERGVVKEIQYDSFGTRMIHVDVARVDLQERISMSVPVLTEGISKGQNSGGTLDVPLKELYVEGPAGSIPESFVVKIAHLDINDSIRVKDIEVPPGCSLEHDPEDVIVVIHEKRGELEEAEAAEGTPSEPEVISKKKEEDGESS